MKVIIISTLILAFVAQSCHGSSINSMSKFCDFLAAKPECDKYDVYRTINGFCNNLENPKWGAEFAPYERFMGTSYQDGIFEIIKSVQGGDLPNARKLSLKLFNNNNITSTSHTVILPQYGQFVAEDQGSVADILIPRPCCFPNGTLEPLPHDPMCLYVPIDSDDPTYGEQQRECMNFMRTTTDLSSNCPGFNNNGEPAKQLNAVTVYLDLSGIYGSNDEDANSVRAYKHGLLKAKFINGVEYPPYMTKATSVCPEDNVTGRCYLGGDFRMNEFPGLASIHIIFIREHNRLARELRKINPHWSDEKIFQEARRINIAEFQHITYYQYFPEILGKWNMRKNLVIFYDRGSERVDDYDSTVNPGLTHEFATAAYRFFHTMVRGNYDLISLHEQYVGVNIMKDTYFRPGFLQTGTFMDDISRGMCREAASAPDDSIDDGVKEFLFRGPSTFALDLKAMDIQRGRDSGLVSYNAAREYCGLPRAKTWSDFSDEIPQNHIDNLRTIYNHPDDVELTVGGALERILPDALTGQTYNCIIMKQMYMSRVSDRFWYETADAYLKFSRPQLEQIRKTSLARIYCDNGKDITKMQRNVFRLPSELNPIVDCNRIPKLNLRNWKE